jgi:Ca-activated chloride channel family protein
LLLALVLAAPAAAQSGRVVPPDEQPVVGGGSFNAAPILEPGKYRDTILPAEYLYYAIKVEPGQRVHITGATDQPGEVDLLRDLGVPAVYLTIMSPTRMESNSGGTSTVRGDLGSPGGADFVGPPAEAADDTDTGGPWTGSGIYFLSVQAVWRGSEPEPPKAEIPFHFTVSLEGQARARVTPTPTPSPTATAAATASPGGEGSGGSGAVAAGAGLGGLLIGVVAGIAVLRRRR